ncbi:hypothetical protein ACQ4M3_32960 [Leptolyngbya sp. AN03gr2]|uniref:hypothetical protein n=1 Tax=unclassified Leptolyngbya TaxID=2650499 RepID=UPI003D310FA1
MSIKKFDYRVRIQVAAESPDGILLDCLKNERHQSYSHKEMLLWALRAYWMPIAYQLQQEQGKRSLSEAQMKRMAQDAIHQLRQQIAYLQSTFGIEQNLSTEGAISPQLSQQLLALFAAHQVAEPETLENSAAPPIDSGDLKLESTSIEGEVTNDQKNLWYDSEDLFGSEI